MNHMLNFIQTCNKFHARLPKLFIHIGPPIGIEYRAGKKDLFRARYARSIPGTNGSAGETMNQMSIQ